MLTQVHADSLTRRLVGRYLMFGLAGVFASISLAILFSHHGMFFDYVGLAAASAVGMLIVGAVVLYRTARVNQAIELQLRKIASVSSPFSPTLEPLAESDSAAIGWNAILKHLQEMHTDVTLDARVNDLAEAGDSQKWSAIFHSLSDGIAVCDHDEIVVMANNAFSALVGLENSNQACGQNIIVLLESITEGRAANELANSLSSSAPFVTEVRRGKELVAGVWRLSRTPIIGENNKESVKLWTIRDITQQKLAEDMRNQFVFTATHELRTPLANIKAYAETLADADDIDVKEQQKFFNIINNEATRLARFVDELLNVSQMESGAVTITRSEVDTERLLNEVIENLQPQILQKQHTFEQQFPAKLPKLRVDKDKIVAALVNLLGNAVKYTPVNGSVRFLVEADDNHISFHVEDTGIGISADELSRIGEKFFRSSDSRVLDVVGSGLGLAFAQEVARLHSGKLAIKSELNKGSRFTLILPLT